MDELCSIEGLKANYYKYYNQLMNQFSQLCLDQETCDLYVRNTDWPDKCRDKIGLRLQIVNVPVVRYLEDISTIEKNIASAAPVLDEDTEELSTPQNTTSNETASSNKTASSNSTVCDPRVTTNCTTTKSTYIEYQKAYEYVISDSSTSFYLYSVVECKNEQIDLANLGESVSLDRKTMGLVAVFTDLVYMSFFLLSLWAIAYFVKGDSERHRNLLFETREFAVVVKNLPKLSASYTIDQMKAELWDHLQNTVKQHSHQIQKLKDSEESRSCEIIDIQFAMSDYRFLEDVVKIKKLSQAIERVENKANEDNCPEKKLEKLHR